MKISLEHPSPPFLWILDWDGTITKVDTLDTLVKIAAQKRPEGSILDSWSQLVAAYVADYDAIMGHLPMIQARRGAGQSLRAELEILERLEDAERSSLRRVAKSGIFSGLTKADLERGATEAIESSRVELRHGFTDFYDDIVRSHSHGTDRDAVNILSVNWSQVFVAASLRAGGCNLSALGSICCNELDGIAENKISSGSIVNIGLIGSMITCSREKAMQLHVLCSDAETSFSRPSIYVGDSWTDLECLLDADLGICIRDDPMNSTQQKLADSLQRTGIDCPHIHNAMDKDKSSIVWARDFTEIRTWLAGT